MELALVLAAFSVPLGLSIWATWLVANDSLTEGKQKVAQLMVVWLLPIIGAVIILAVHRRNEPPSRQYREQLEPGDDLAVSGRAFKGIREVLDGDE